MQSMCSQQALIRGPPHSLFQERRAGSTAMQHILSKMPSATSVVDDVFTGSQAAIAKNPLALSQQQLDYYFGALKDEIPWDRPTVRGRPLPRSACWFTDDKCTCTYRYGNSNWEPFPFTELVSDIRHRIQSLVPDGIIFDSCNTNLYSSGYDGVGWHQDNESLFDTSNKETTILSLSFGVTRTFGIKKKGEHESISLEVESGDVIIMAGKFQRYYYHTIFKDYSTTGCRINLAFRIISNHDRNCSCFAQDS